ncbi:hypothetical protein HDU93_004932 [Gonapodya sp. JEL0774]|nr:hypothetical protein HDU93_004932 [Gonapodya sp. JEL0774]
MSLSSFSRLTQSYISQIERLNPILRAIIEVNPDALTIAADRDAERKAGVVAGPLHGVPIAVKDNIATRDKMETTAGSLALLGAKAPEDATVIAKLRKAGAIILAKANMSEWANCSIKPTVGLISRYGVIPIAGSQDTVGPMARTVRDAVLTLDAIVQREGMDVKDPATARCIGRIPPSYETFLQPRVEGWRVGVARTPYIALASKAAQMGFANALKILQSVGAVVVDPADIPTYAEHFLVFETPVPDLM